MTTTRKQILLSLAAFSALIAGPATIARSQTPPSVTISVTGIASQEGFIMVALFDEAGWRGEPVAATRTAAQDGTVTLALAAPSPGRYGIKLFHDVDSDGELNTNMVGIPTEPYGFSNNAPPQFGPPSFDAAAFDIGPDGADQTISLN